MGMFSNLMGNIFGKGKKSKPDAAKDAAEKTNKAEADKSVSQATEAPQEMEQVDVTAILNEMAAKNSESLDWKKSIVDLMKLVGMDSSYGSRKELALELGYSQKDIDEKGSAEMNTWLHKAVMVKLAENGGKVPSELLD